MGLLDRLFGSADEDGPLTVDRSSQVIHLSSEEPGAFLSPVPPPTPWISLALLAAKAKQVDDRIYAAAERAAQDGFGTWTGGKRALLGGLLDVLRPGPRGVSTIAAAAKLGGLAVPAALAADADREAAAFLADAVRSKPLGFYAGDPALEAIFRQDRMLQTELEAPDLSSVVDALRANSNMFESYARAQRLAERLTNPFARADLRTWVKEGAAPASVSFSPPSIAHETELVKKLYGNRPIPDDFVLADAFVDAVRKRKIDLTPRAESGWYDVQTWSLEPLASPNEERLEVDDAYRAHLVRVLEGILALTRETHVKQLEIPRAGGAAPMASKVVIRPELTIEPLATYYERRAESYVFVRKVLEAIFGEAPNGEEIDRVEALFRAAASRARWELVPVGAEPPKLSLQGDPDLARDVRMMVPLFFDIARGKIKVWAVLGWSTDPVRASFLEPPTLSRKKGVELGVSEYPAAVPVMVEAYVSRLLDRAEMRALCDRHRTAEAIVAAL